MEAGAGTRWSLKVPSNKNKSMILWFCCISLFSMLRAGVGHRMTAMTMCSSGYWWWGRASPGFRRNLTVEKHTVQKSWSHVPAGTPWHSLSLQGGQRTGKVWGRGGWRAVELDEHPACSDPQGQGRARSNASSVITSSAVSTTLVICLHRINI